MSSPHPQLRPTNYALTAKISNKDYGKHAEICMLSGMLGPALGPKGINPTKELALRIFMARGPQKEAIQPCGLIDMTAHTYAAFLPHTLSQWHALVCSAALPHMWCAHRFCGARRSDTAGHAARARPAQP